MKKVIIIILFAVISNSMLGQEISVGAAYVGYNNNQKIGNFYGGSVIAADPIKSLRGKLKLLLGGTFVGGNALNYGSIDKGYYYSYISLLANAGIALTQNGIIDVSIISGIGVRSFGMEVLPVVSLEMRITYGNLIYSSIGYGHGGNILGGFGVNIPL